MAALGPAMDAIARDFVDAFNRRDAGGLVALTDPAVVWQPSRLVGSVRRYRGHDELRRWVAELDASPIKHRARVLEVRIIDHDRFLVLSEVLLDDVPVCPSALLARVSRGGKILEARAYLTDEQMLIEAGIVPAIERPAVSAGRQDPSSPERSWSVGRHDRARSQSRAA